MSATCSITVSSPSITAGQSVVISWNSTGAAGGTISGIGVVGPSGSVTIWPGQSTTYSGTFGGLGATASCAASVFVVQPQPQPAPAPTCVINASPTVITQQGQNITLNWNSQNATVGSITNIGQVGPSGSQLIAPAQNTSYTGTFSGPGGTVNCNVTVIVNINSTPQPTCTLTANPAVITAGQSATLTWTSQGATSGSIGNGVGSVNPSGSLTVTPAQSTTYVATFTGSGGTVNCQATITVGSVTNPNNPAPTCVINASPTVITQQGQNITLNWNSQNATVGSITNIGSIGPSGSMSVSPSQSGTYTATFTGPGGTVNCNVNVTVNINNSNTTPQPSCTLYASPSNVQSGQPVTLTWTSQNTSGGSISGLGSVGPNGSQTVWPNSSQSYSATFYGSNGQNINCYTSVNITPYYYNNYNNYSSPYCTLTASASVINPGQPVTLSWYSNNANWGTITGLGSVGPNGSQTVWPTQSTSYEGTFSGPNGSVNCFATVNVNNAYNYYVPPPTQPPYVQLSSAPYTGLDLGPWGTALYWAFLLAWCAFAAYLVAVKRIQNKLFDYVLGVYYGTPAMAAAGPVGILQPAAHPAPTAPREPAQAASRDATDSFIMSQIGRKK